MTQRFSRFFLFSLLLSLGLLLFSSFYSSTEISTKEKLGEKLFFDPILSSDNSISCSSCHKPEFGFADTIAFSKGVNNTLTLRNTPSVMNVTERSFFFWDGRAGTLQEQAKGPIENPGEMNLPISAAVKKINASEEYQLLFKKIYNELPSEKNILEAISAYEKTLETQESEFDLAVKSDNYKIDEDIEAGRKLFVGKGNCFDCHSGPDFTNDEFRNIGLFNGKNLNDSGRFKVTKNAEDLGRFKVPSLRNVAVTAPYMHNGQFKTLTEVVNYYSNPNLIVTNSQNKDTLIKALNFSEKEKLQLVSFLKALTDKRFLK